MAVCGEKYNKRTLVVFVVEETTPGTLEVPTQQDAVLAVGLPTLTQQPNFTASEELRDSLDVIDEVPDVTPQGDFSLNIYHRPAGRAGDLPVERALMKAAYPVVTVTPDTSVEYALTKGCKPTVSAWWRLGNNIVGFAEGVVVGGHNPNNTNTGYFNGVFTGVFRRKGTLGPTTVDGPFLTGVSVMKVAEIDQLNAVGGQFTVEGSATIYQITNVDTATSNITFTPTLTDDIADLANITPYLPEPITFTSTTVDGVTLTGETDLLATDVTKLAVNGKITIEGSATEYNIDSIDTGLGQFTISPALTDDIADLAVITPVYLAPVDGGLGVVGEARKARVEIDGVVGAFTEMNITMQQADEWLTNEVTPTEYPESFVVADREVTGTLTANFVASAVKAWAEGQRGDEHTLKYSQENGVGASLDFELPRAKIQVPSMADGPAITFAREFRGLGTGAEDSIKATYR